ncbi:Rpn family recombination-promoting nuclease/putative transposase [Amedibacillus sp. YH-ame10]
MATKDVTKVSYKNDVFFKFALSSQDEDSKMIRHFMIKEITGIDPVDSIVVNPEMDPEALAGKKIILDVHVKDIHGNEYDMEMQVEGLLTNLTNRFEYYGAKMLEKQLKEGEDYLDLKPVYQIIFMDNYSEDKGKLIMKYQMRNEEGKEESTHALIHRTYIHLPVINDIVKKKKTEELTAFEQMCYLFKNNEDDDIIKTKESVVRKLMEKHERMSDNEQIWTLAEQIQMAEAQQKAIQQGYYDEGIKIGEEKGLKIGEEIGKVEGYNKLLNQLIQTKFNVDASSWLSTLTIEQLQQVSQLLMNAQTFEEIQSAI